jgi:hypothetical protein
MLGLWLRYDKARDECLRWRGGFGPSLTQEHEQRQQDAALGMMQLDWCMRDPRGQRTSVDAGERA